MKIESELMGNAWYYIAGTLLSVVVLLFYQYKVASKNNKAGIKVLFFILSVLPLFLLSSLRWNVGTDTWHTYTPEYLALKSEAHPLTSEEEQIMVECYQMDMQHDEGFTAQQAEAVPIEDIYRYFRTTTLHTAPGFQMLELALISMNADVQWLYVVTSFIILFFIYASIYIQSDEPAAAVLFFVLTGSYFLSMNIIAQFMAISICLFACTFAQKRKLIPFLAFVLLAACFHTSAVVFLPVYILPKIKVKPLYCAVLIAVLFLAAPVVFPLAEKLISIIAPQYVRYFTWESDFEWIFFALGAAILIAGGYYYEEGKDRPYYRLWYYMNVVGMLALCFSGRIPIIKRINYYFAAPHFLFLPLMISCEKKPTLQKILRAVIIGLFAAETFLSIGMMNKNETLPYQTFFQVDQVESTDILPELLLPE